MEPLRTLTGAAISLPDADIDTDIIYPARFLLITAKRGLGRYAFHDRRDAPGFPPIDTHAPILVVGANFGCGSSREQAPWALADLGIRVIVAPSFGEIFHSNCFKNGMLAITLPAASVALLQRSARTGDCMHIDVAAGTLTAPGLGTIGFDLTEDRRQSLLNGWDEIGRIQSLHHADIAHFEAVQRGIAPWLWTQEARTR